MATPIIMPRQGQSVELHLTNGVKVGDEVAEGDVLAATRRTGQLRFGIDCPGTTSNFGKLTIASVLANAVAVGQEGEYAVSFAWSDSDSASPAPDSPPASSSESVASVDQNLHCCK